MWSVYTGRTKGQHTSLDHVPLALGVSGSQLDIAIIGAILALALAVIAELIKLFSRLYRGESAEC